MTQGVGVKLIAAYLGIPEWQVRRVITKHHIQPVGQAWKANMYDLREVLKHAKADEATRTKQT